MQQTLLQKRFKLIKLIREFFYQEGFIEVDTPLLSNSPGIEPYLEPFSTYIKLPNKKRIRKYLPFSPEFYMKRLLSMGFDKIFQIAHCFRNNELSKMHQPEFLMLEWYRKHASYHHLAEDTQNLILFIAKNFNIQSIKVNGKIIDLSKPWQETTIKELFTKFLRIELENYSQPESLINKIIELGSNINKQYFNDWNSLFFYTFLNLIEPNLDCSKPLFIMDYPSSVSALAKPKEANGFYCERFELYIGKVEVVNACTELTDYTEHINRSLLCNRQLKKMNRRTYPFDKEFFAAIKNDFADAAGAALGIDRLIMLLLEQSDISSVIPFPPLNIDTA